MRRTSFLAAALTCAALPLTAGLPLFDAPPSLPASSRIVDVTPPGALAAESLALNERGDVAGFVTDAEGRDHAFARLGAVSRRLDEVKGVESRATAINSSGHIAGWLDTAGGERRGFLLRDGKVAVVHALNGKDTWITGMNDGGRICGSTFTYFEQGFAFTQAATTSSLGSLGGKVSEAWEINARGWIAGVSQTSNEKSRAFLWRDGRMADLAPKTPQETAAYALNDRGEAVGTVLMRPEVTRACTFEGGRAKPLPGGAASAALGINRRGEIVGWMRAPDGAQRAALWIGGRVRDLNTLLPKGSGWTLTEARGINSAGQICGTGLLRDRPRAFLLAPPRTQGRP
jgi:probable HAF family extracellular repeat protein